MTRIPVNPELLTWAHKRAGLDVLALAARFSKLTEWEAGERQLTLRQLEDFARAVHVAVGYLFLTSPTQVSLPTPDSAQLRDTLLPKLISGELRIADAEKFMERAEHQASDLTRSAS